MDKKNTLYLECETGISGDMAVAALLDLGADQEKLLKVLSGIQDPGFQVKIGRVSKAGIDCCDFDVILDAEHDGHDHDMEYLYGHLSGNEIHGHSHRDDHGDGHGHEDNHSHGDTHDHGEAHVHEDDHDHGNDHGHVHGDVNGHEDGYVHGDAHSHEGTHGHGDTHGHEDAHVHGDVNGHEDGYVHGDFHGHEDGHHHGDYHHHYHHHHHTSLKDVQKIIAGLEMTEGARKLALRIFDIVAQAESKAHGVPACEVHFHEVGAIDSIVDIVSIAVCFDDLQIGDVIIPRITEGSGTVRCQHGILPVPVPAVMGIAQACGLPLHISSRQGELVTPTGAAFAAAVMTGDTLPETFRVKKIGMGAGKRAYEIPSILRAMLIESREGDRIIRSGERAGKRGADDAASAETAGTEGGKADKAYAEKGHTAADASLTEPGQKAQEVQNLHTASVEADSADRIWKLECDVDDSTGEQLGYTMERLYKAGAREVHFSSVFMKKNRPGWELTVLCDGQHRQALENIVFEETTTLGIRRLLMERTVLSREFVKVTTDCGPVTVKISGEGRQKKVHPEYEDVAEAAERAQMPFAAVYRAALEAVRGQE